MPSVSYVVTIAGHADNLQFNASDLERTLKDVFLTGGIDVHVTAQLHSISTDGDKLICSTENQQ